MSNQSDDWFGLTREQWERMGESDMAKHLLKRNFAMLAKAAGVAWDASNEAEIDVLIDCIVKAAVNEAQSADQS